MEASEGHQGANRGVGGQRPMQPPYTNGDGRPSSGFGAGPSVQNARPGPAAANRETFFGRGDGGQPRRAEAEPQQHWRRPYVDTVRAGFALELADKLAYASVGRVTFLLTD